MPLIFTIAWSYLGGWWTMIVLPLIKIIPWQVWAGIAGVIAVLYYGHVRENRGYEKCEVQVKVANDKEVAREKQITDAATQSALVLARQKAEEAQHNAEARDEALQQVAKLKEAGQVCIPKSVTGKFQRR